MRVTVDIHDEILALLRREAARQGCSESVLVESALRLLLKRKTMEQPLPPLPTFGSGGHLVDIDRREDLHDAMEDRDPVA